MHSLCRQRRLTQCIGVKINRQFLRSYAGIIASSRFKLSHKCALVFNGAESFLFFSTVRSRDFEHASDLTNWITIIVDC